MFGMLSLELDAIKRHRAYVEEQLKSAVPWDEDKTKFAPWLFLKGDTFDTSKYYVFPSAPVIDNFRADDAPLNWSPDKTFCYGHRRLKRGNSLQIAQGWKRGEVVFDSDVAIPIIAEAKRGYDGERKVVMSITPMELLTQRRGVMLATGKVMVCGLGMGWLLRKVAAKPSVKEIIVVEISKEIMDWFGTALCKKVAEESGKPVKVIVGDAADHVGMHGAEVRHLVDVWMSYPTPAYSLEDKWKHAIARTNHFWGWGVISE